MRTKHDQQKKLLKRTVNEIGVKKRKRERVRRQVLIVQDGKCGEGGVLMEPFSKEARTIRLLQLYGENNDDFQKEEPSKQGSQKKQGK